MPDAYVPETPQAGSNELMSATLPGPVSPPGPAPAPLSPLEAAAEVAIPGLPENPGPAAEGALAFFNPDAIPYALILVIGTAIAVRVVQNLANRVAESAVGYRLVIKQGVTLMGFVAYGIAGVLAVLALFDLSAQAIFALSGTLAVAGGFLLKDVAEATVAGISILVSRPFQVGDRISFGGFYGEVQDIGLRSVRLVTLDDNLVTIPSSKFLSEPVASANSGALDCMVVMPFFVSAEADHVRARQIVIDAVRASRYLYLGKPVTVLVGMKLAENLGTVVELTAKAYVYDARHEKSFSSDVTDRVLRAFRGAGILFPSEVGA